MSQCKQPLVEQVLVGTFKNFSYIVADNDMGEATLIDPAFDVPKLLEKLESANLRLKYVVNTHAHFDHIEGNPLVVGRTGAKIVMEEHSKARKDITVKDGQELKLGERVILHFLHTPGHSPESMCIIVSDSGIFTGDTLFVGECGRVDLPGGDANALYDSLEKLRKLDSKLRVYPGHDYGPKPFSTLAEEFDTNYTLAKRSREDFVRFMSEP